MLESIKKPAFVIIIPVVLTVISGSAPTLYEAAAAALLSELTLMKWLNSSYFSDGSSVSLRQGIVFRRARLVQAGAVSCVHIDSSAAAALFGCVKCSIYTAASHLPPEKLYISREESRRLFGGTGGMIRIPARCVLINAVFGSNAIPGIISVISVATQAGRLLGSQVQSGVISGLAIGRSYLLEFFPPLYAMLISAIAAGLSVSASVSLIKNANLSVYAGDGKIISSRGLIFRHITIIYTSNIVSLTVRRTFAMRLFGLASLEYGAPWNQPRRAALIAAAPREVVESIASSCIPHHEPACIRSSARCLPKFFKNSALCLICTLIPVMLSASFAPALVEISAAASLYPASKAAVSLAYSYRRWRHSGVSGDMTYIERVRCATYEQIYLNGRFLSKYRLKTLRGVLRRNTDRYCHAYFSTSGGRRRVKLKYLPLPAGDKKMLTTASICDILI